MRVLSVPAKNLNYIKDNLPDYTSEVTMLHEINVHSVMTDKALSSYFHNAGELLADESAVLHREHLLIVDAIERPGADDKDDEKPELRIFKDSEKILSGQRVGFRRTRFYRRWGG